MDGTIPDDQSEDADDLDPLVQILSFFALECGWSPKQTLNLSLDGLGLLAEGISKRKISWIEGIVQGIFGKPSKKQAVMETLQKLDVLKTRGLVEDIG
jgi:hypothetical protein